jgi:DNA polymerase-3 subunit delta
MKLSLEGLTRQLAERLLPVYLISGDEPLLVGEALDAIRARARAQGFSEREVFFFERANVGWEPLLQAAQSLSLFAERRIIEARLPGGKPGPGGSAALLRIVESARTDLLLLVVTDRLEREAQAADWVRVISEHGAWLPIWPVDRNRLPQWLQSRMRRAGLTASPESLELLAERSEGNLLAAQQEIDKLALLLPSGAVVTPADVLNSSTDSARFDVFQLGEAVRARDAARALRILGGLRAERSEPTLVLWALLRELRGSGPPRAGAHSGQSASMAELVARAARVDRIAKGLAAGDPWDELAWFVAELTGAGPARPLLAG